MSFAPPASFDNPQPGNHDQEMPDAGRVDESKADEPSGEDAYLRRMQMAQPPTVDLPPPPPPPPDSVTAPPPPPPAARPNATISRAPVRYALPEAPPTLPTNEDNPNASEDEMDIDIPADLPTDSNGPQAAPSLRPGQKGFAERYMAKLGYQKGQGLGATGSGITSALSVQKQKQKKRSDAEGGGLVNKAAMGKIVGGKRVKKDDDEGLHGKMSSVVKLVGMLNGMDVEAELGMHGSFVQEIGQDCGDKVCSIDHSEYVFTDIPDSTAQLSASTSLELSRQRILQSLSSSRVSCPLSELSTRSMVAHSLVRRLRQGSGTLINLRMAFTRRRTSHP